MMITMSPLIMKWNLQSCPMGKKWIREKCYSDAVYTWLANNAYRYGFIQRYPSDKTDITGVNNEPWHYRYVGVEAAQEMQEKGLCLEEYTDLLKS